MGWQPGSAFLGVGLAFFMWVSPMMGIIIPSWMLPLLLSLSILLILVWPVSAIIAGLIADQKKRLVIHIRVWSVLILITVLGAYRLPLGTTTGASSQTPPHIAMTPSLEMMGNQATVMVMFHNRGKEDVDKLTLKILLNDGEKFNENLREVPILRSDINRKLFVMIPQDLYAAVIAGKETLKVKASAAYSFHGAPYAESCTMKWNASMRLFDYIDC